MKYIKIGKIVNTHGIKGEIRLRSNFQYKDKVFKTNMNIFIGKDKVNKVINTYRPHKTFDMITINGINNINDVIKYKSKDVFINEIDLILENNEILIEDLIDYEIFNNNEFIGTVVNFMNNSAYDLLILDNGKKIPFLDEFIIKIEKKKIYVNLPEGYL
ncbi:MAG: ribosome maturation factor RimM [Bacilli bacterium]